MSVEEELNVLIGMVYTQLLKTVVSEDLWKERKILTINNQKTIGDVWIITSRCHQLWPSTSKKKYASYKQKYYEAFLPTFVLPCTFFDNSDLFTFRTKQVCNELNLNNFENFYQFLTPVDREKEYSPFNPPENSVRLLYIAPMLVCTSREANYGIKQ